MLVDILAQWLAPYCDAFLCTMFGTGWASCSGTNICRYIRRKDKKDSVLYAASMIWRLGSGVCGTLGFGILEKSCKVQDFWLEFGVQMGY